MPCHNAAETIVCQLDALARQQWPGTWECVVADNRSSDDSRKIVADYQDRLPGLRLVDATERAGAAYARNVAVRHARGDLLVFCDADDLVADGWLAAMAEALRSQQLVACRVETRKLNPPWLHGHEQEHALQTIWYPPWLSHAGGGTLGCWRSLFDQLGGFDETMTYLEDTEFCFQAQLRGIPMGFVPDAVVHIRRRSSLLEHYRQSRNYAAYNVILAKRYEISNDGWWESQRQYLREWRDLLRSVSGLRGLQQRYAWVWQFGRQMGRLEGQLRCGGRPV